MKKRKEKVTILYQKKPKRSDYYWNRQKYRSFNPQKVTYDKVKDLDIFIKQKQLAKKSKKKASNTHEELLQKLMKIDLSDLDEDKRKTFKLFPAGDDEDSEIEKRLFFLKHGSIRIEEKKEEDSEKVIIDRLTHLGFCSEELVKRIYKQFNKDEIATANFLIDSIKYEEDLEFLVKEKEIMDRLKKSKKVTINTLHVDKRKNKGNKKVISSQTINITKLRGKNANGKRYKKNNETPIARKQNDKSVIKSKTMIGEKKNIDKEKSLKRAKTMMRIKDNENKGLAKKFSLKNLKLFGKKNKKQNTNTKIKKPPLSKMIQEKVNKKDQERKENIFSEEIQDKERSNSGKISSMEWKDNNDGDSDSISQLTSLGFTFKEASNAYYAHSRNVSNAANYLFEQKGK